MTVLVTGATGFLGRRVVQSLIQTNHEVRVMVRNPGSESVLSTPPADVCYGNVTDPDALTEACRGISEVIHLVAVIRGGPRQFDAINRQGTANVVAAARAAGSVRRFVHVSALGAANVPNLRYLHSKWAGEREVVNGGMPYVIVRPSLIFGPGDEFTNAVAALVRSLPITPVIGSGNNRLQPIHVEDVARCVALSLSGNVRGNRIVEIGGPDQLSYNDVIRTVARTLGCRRLLVNVPIWKVRLPIALMELLTPRPPINSAMLQLITLRNVADPDSVEREFGFSPRPMAGNIGHLEAMTLIRAIRSNLGLR
jgi:NADH dehydrogenase